MNIGGKSFNNGIYFNSDHYTVKFTMDKNNNFTLTQRKNNPINKIRKKYRNVPLLKGLLNLLSSRLSILLILFAVAVDLSMYFTQKIRTENVDSVISLVLIIILLIYIVIGLRTIIFKIKNIWAYHGAEHKVINAYENKLELTLENIRNSPREAKRCGTNMCVFLILFAIPSSFLITFSSVALIISFTLAYELFDIDKGDKAPVLKVFFKIGYWFQTRLVTKEPTDMQIEAAIKAFRKLIELENKT